MLYRLVFRALALSVAFTLALSTVSRPAHADARTEGAAKALENKAMQEDYLATDFDKALEKLNQASSKCGERCSSIVRAQIKRDIGVVQVAKGNHEAAVAAFTEAMKADTNVSLDPDTRTKDIDAAWAEAKKQAASGGAASGPPPAGDFSMAPAPETLVRTPLDVYGEYTGTETLAKVVLKYKAFGMPDWKTIEMKSMDKGWGAEIPCADVTQGDVLYYVQGFNAANDPVATSGDRNNPFHTTAKPNTTAAIPHFPGKDPPRQCADSGDCPPDFPGCKKPAAASEEESPDSDLKDEGADCEDNSECKSDVCGENKTCKGGSKAPSKYKKFWIGIDAAYDFVNLPSGSDVCALGTGAGGPFPGAVSAAGTPVPQANNYYCTLNGSDFPGNVTNDDRITPGESDKVQPGGFAPGNFRAALSFDYAASANVMIGLRIGYVFNGYTGTFASKLPIHAELRATYLIGSKVLERDGLAPYVMIAGGASQYSAEVGVTAISTGAGCSANPQSCTAYAQAWHIGGPGFVALGAGIRYGFSPRVQLLFGPRFTTAFGSYNTLVAISPELGLQYGF